MEKVSKATPEVIWHFTCDFCKNWWSVSAVDDWKPRRQFCPHCARLHYYDHGSVEEKLIDSGDYT